MARRTATKSRSRSTRSRQDAAPRPPRRAPRAAEAEVVEEEGAGDGGATGMAVLTSVLLVAAILCVDAMLGRYGEGVFF